MGQASSFDRLAAALIETADQAAVTLARLADAIDPGTAAAIAEREALVREAGRMLAELAPQERLARELARVGALVDFPAFTAQVRDIRPEDVVLLRGVISEVWPRECQVVLVAERLTIRVVIGRSDIVGVEKRAAPLTRS